MTSATTLRLPRNNNAAVIESGRDADVVTTPTTLTALRDTAAKGR